MAILKNKINNRNDKNTTELLKIHLNENCKYKNKSQLKIFIKSIIHTHT